MILESSNRVLADGSSLVGYCTDGKRHRTPTSLTINGEPAELTFARASKGAAVRLCAPEARWCARKQPSHMSGSLQTGKIGSLDRPRSEP